MTAVAPARPAAAWKPNDRWLLGVVLAVVTFWLFAPTLLNVIPGIQGSLGLGPTVANLAVSITALMSLLRVGIGLLSFLGWRSIFWISIAVALLSLYLTKDTPVSKAPAPLAGRFDWWGLVMQLPATPSFGS